MPRLNPANWESGEIIRLIDPVALFGKPDAMIADLRQVCRGLRLGGGGDD
jgi:hemolysin-activating ACP:hemolysin acyltransferase